MPLPEVEIQPGDSLKEAVLRVEHACEVRGVALFAFDNLNSFLPISSVCHFFQATSEGREAVLVIMTGEWDEKTVLTVLNVLLEIRMDPDPPGKPPLFRFYGPHAVPPVLGTLFGDSEVSEFECRAALVARFGKDLLPGRALQLAAAAVQLLRETLGARVDFYDAPGDLVLGSAVVERLRAQGFPEEGAPLNALITIGFLYGERLRARLSYPSRWVRLREPGPWPVIVFGPEESEPRPREGGAAGRRGEPRVVFNPVGTVISLYQGGGAEGLEESARDLSRRLEKELEAGNPAS
jgi:hypothetical protein